APSAVGAHVVGLDQVGGVVGPVDEPGPAVRTRHRPPRLLHRQAEPVQLPALGPWSVTPRVVGVGHGRRVRRGTAPPSRTAATGAGVAPGRPGPPGSPARPTRTWILRTATSGEDVAVRIVHGERGVAVEGDPR